MHAPDYMILTPKIEKSPYRGRGDTPLPHPPPARSLRSLGLGRSAPSHFPLQVGNHPPTFEDLSTPLAGTITHEKCRLGRFRSVLKSYSLWIKWVLKFLILWSDEINHSNFENATKCLNKSWWYLLKHACFILKLKDFCNTCVHFQWKKTNASRHIGILSALRMRCACVVCMTSASSWPICVSRVARIKTAVWCKTPFYEYL